MQCKLASCCWDAVHSMSCHQRGNFQALYSTAPPQMTVTLSLFSRLDTLPSFSIQTLFYGTQVSALTVLRPAAILVPRCALWCSPPTGKPSTHFIASLLHGTATHLVGKRLVNILQSIPNRQLRAALHLKASDYSRELCITRFDQKSRGHLKWCLFLNLLFAQPFVFQEHVALSSHRFWQYST